MKEVKEQEFYNFIGSLQSGAMMKKSSLINPVTLSFFQNDERVAVIVVAERDDWSTAKYLIKDN